MGRLAEWQRYCEKTRRSRPDLQEKIPEPVTISKPVTNSLSYSKDSFNLSIREAFQPIAVTLQAQLKADLARIDALAAGFNDMLPLLEEIGEKLSDGNRTLGANLAVYLSRQNEPESPQRAKINQMLADFKTGLDPEAYPDGVSEAVDKFAAQLYFHLAFRQMDLFHPFIII